MTRFNVSLPDDLGDWATARAAQGGYGDPADYVGELVRRERDHEEKRARLRAAIDEGLASPEVDTTIEDIIAERRGAQAAE